MKSCFSISQRQERRVVVVVVVVAVVVVVVVAVVKKVLSHPTMGGVIFRLGTLPEPWESENTSF